MARNNIDATGWLVEGKDSDVVKAFVAQSAWEKVARPLSMTGNAVRIPRIADMGVAVIAKGAAADLTILDRNFTVLQTWIGGVAAWSGTSATRGPSTLS